MRSGASGFGGCEGGGVDWGVHRSKRNELCRAVNTGEGTRFFCGKGRRTFQFSPLDQVDCRSIRLKANKRSCRAAEGCHPSLPRRALHLFERMSGVSGQLAHTMILN